MLADLLACPGVSENLKVAGPVGFMALHGGLEGGTEEIASWAAASCRASLYTVTQPNHLAWHLPSPNYDPSHSRRLARFIASVDWTLSVHGYGRTHLPGTILAGGRNRHLAALLARELRRRGGFRVIDDLSHIPTGLRGLHPANPVNLPNWGGAQLELPREARQGAWLGVVADSLAAVASQLMRSRRR